MKKKGKKWVGDGKCVGVENVSSKPWSPGEWELGTEAAEITMLYKMSPLCPETLEDTVKPCGALCGSPVEERRLPH